MSDEPVVLWNNPEFQSLKRRVEELERKQREHGWDSEPPPPFPPPPPQEDSGPPPPFPPPPPED